MKKITKKIRQERKGKSAKLYNYLVFVKLHIYYYGYSMRFWHIKQIPKLQIVVVDEKLHSPTYFQ